MLEAAYALNDHALGDYVKEGVLHKVLMYYVLVLDLGHEADISNVSRHQAIKARTARVSTDRY